MRCGPPAPMPVTVGGIRGVTHPEVCRADHAHDPTPPASPAPLSPEKSGLVRRAVPGQCHHSRNGFILRDDFVHVLIPINCRRGNPGIAASGGGRCGGLGRGRWNQSPDSILSMKKVGGTHLADTHRPKSRQHLLGMRTGRVWCQTCRAENAPDRPSVRFPGPPVPPQTAGWSGSLFLANATTHGTSRLLPVYVG